MNVVLLDGSYFNFYRYFATSKWWSFKSNQPGSLDDEVFVKALESQYLSNLKKMELLTKVDHSEFYLIKDCPQSSIWRNQIYEDYKEHRKGKAPDAFGYLNSRFKNEFKAKIRVCEAEADDVIAITTKVFQSMGYKVWIISGDKDFLQLEDAEIIDATGKRLTVDDPKDFLRKKILKGDKTDNIKSVKYPWPNHPNSAWNYIQNSILIDFDYIPRLIQDRIVTELHNQKIIDIRNLNFNWNPKDIQLGLCCMNTIGTFCSRKPIIETIEKKSLEYLYEIVEENIKDLVKLIEWNYQNGISVLRISSGLIPHKSNQRIKFGSLDRFQHLFDSVGELARRYRQRLTFHPGQYNVVGTPNEEAFLNTVLDLDYHAEVLDRLGCDQDSVMVIHGGGLYNESKEKNIMRWKNGFNRLPERVRRRLVIENDERAYNIEDCLKISSETGIPVVFDTHHHDCYIATHPIVELETPETYIPKILSTWGNIKPKFHVSEQGTGRRGCHSDFIQKIPDYLLKIPEKYNIQIDIMIEAKMKEQAVKQLYEKYPQIDPENYVNLK